MAATEALNKRLGRDSVRIVTAALASHGNDIPICARRLDWRSPRFTTRWGEIPVVKA